MRVSLACVFCSSADMNIGKTTSLLANIADTDYVDKARYGGSGEKGT